MLSILALFKTGLGPSSSHTMGPMIIARRFLETVEAKGQLDDVARVTVELQGSLALTGMGHGTDRAVILGLAGIKPAEANPDDCERLEADIRAQQKLAPLGGEAIKFDPEADIIFAMDVLSENHPNSMRLVAYAGDGSELHSDTYLSLGGGFVCRDADYHEVADDETVGKSSVPYEFKFASDLLSIGNTEDLTIAQIALANEDAFRPREETRKALDAIWEAMNSSIERGISTDGVLPGQLNVKRRAHKLYDKLTQMGLTPNEEETLFDRLNVYAMAVNEENAAGGRIVTAPTNGAAGILPAIIKHYCIGRPNEAEGIRRFLLTAGAVGLLYKMNASISGAEMGCQGEVGVACSMAAAGLAAVWGGSNEAIEHAAEIAMEHNLGLTCDPVGGLVQIPCIERNAIGAVKAANAARLAIRTGGPHHVSLDQVIETMRQTGADMNTRYKETSQGGLAVNVVAC